MSESSCEICTSEKSKYCCPRCSVLYCSLACYKSQKHSDCSEEFYKEAVIAELKDQTSTDESPAKILDILKRLNEDTDFLDPLDDEEGDPNEIIDSDDEDGTDLADRLKGVNLDNGDAVWDRLTDAERQQFKNLVNTGDIFNLLPKKEPWYTTGTDVPGVKSKLLDYDELSSKPPAASVRFNLINILAAYSYMTRYFMSDQQSFPAVDVSNCLYSLSAALKRSCDFDSIDVAVKSLYVEGISHQFEVDKEMHPTVLTDVRTIILGPSESESYILACLSDMIKIFKKVKTMNGASSQPATSKGSFTKQFNENLEQTIIPSSAFTPLIKRLEFFLSYTKRFYVQEIVNLIKIEK